ncbi:MAG: hypothetical protein IJ845_06570 [Bacteroidaceae bacterium]|nr:hypothetical protein [Bacteroidaceae bacterium]
MKTNIAYLFAAMLTIFLLSCSGDSEPLVVAEEEMQLNSDPMIDYQTASDAQRSLRPKATTQQMDGDQPDKKGEKGRDHRDWINDIGRAAIKNFEKETKLGYGDLYAIDKDGVNPYIVKFYFPEEDYEEYATKYEGRRVSVSMIYINGNGSSMHVKTLYDTYSFSLDDSFLVSRTEFSNGYFDYVLHYYLSGENRRINFKDLPIIKQWH